MAVSAALRACEGCVEQKRLRDFIDLRFGESWEYARCCVCGLSGRLAVRLDPSARDRFVALEREGKRAALALDRLELNTRLGGVKFMLHRVDRASTGFRCEYRSADFAHHVTVHSRVPLDWWRPYEWPELRRMRCWVNGIPVPKSKE